MSSEAKAIVYAGGGGVAVLGLATLGMIAWLFLSALPRARPDRAVAQNDDPPAEPVRVENRDKPDRQDPDRGDADASDPDADTPEPEDAAPADETLAPFIRITLPEEVTASAFDSAGGRLALVGPWPGAVGIVTAEQMTDGVNVDDVELVQLAGTPILVEYKPLPEGGLFLVGQREPDALVLIDPESRELDHAVPLETGTPFQMSVSANPDVQEVWIGTKNGAEKSLARYDLQQRMMAETFKVSSLLDFTASHDGPVLYCRYDNSQLTGRGPIHPHNLARPGWDHESPHQQPDRRYIVGLGRFVVSGNRVYSPDFSVLRAELGFEPEAFLPDRPWAAGIEDSEFVVGSINDGRIVSRFALPAEWHRVQRPGDRRRGREKDRDRWAELLGGRVFADAARDRFLLTTLHHVLEFPLDELDLPDEPLLLLADAVPDAVTVGDTLEFNLTSVSGNPAVELVEAPEGAALEENTLRWTPTPGQFGPQVLTVRMIDGDVVHESRWPVTVRQRMLPLTFLVRGCDPSNDGTHLVAWGHDWPLQPVSRNEMFTYEPDRWRLAVVDLADLSVVAEAEMDGPIHQAEFCGPEVIVSNTNSGPATFQRLSSEDLSQIGRSELFGGDMTCVADQWLVVGYSGNLNAEQPLRLYALPDLTPRDEDQEELSLRITPDAYRDVSMEEYETVYGARRMADGWLFEGALWDDQLSEAVLLLEPRGFLRVSERDLPDPTIAVQRVLAGFLTYRTPMAGHPLDVLEEIKARMHDSPHVAARFGIRIDDQTVWLTLTDIDAEEPYQSIPLRVGPMEHHYPYPDPRAAQFTTSPEFIFVTLAGETFVLPIEPRPLPFRIEPRQSELELSGRSSTRVTYEAEGATRFELEIPALGTRAEPLRLESEDGEFRIDPVDLDQLSAAIWATVGRGQTQELEERISQAGEARRQFIGGRAPAAVAGRIDAFVRATADDGDVAVLKHAFVVMIPRPIFDRNRP